MTKSLTPAEVLGLYEAHDDTIPFLLRTRVAKRAAAEALQFDSRSWTYADLDRVSDLLAAVLAGRKVGKGDRVALISLNTDLHSVIFLALAKLGAIFVPVNPALTTPELEYTLGHCGACLLIAQEADVERVRALAATLQARPTVLGLNELGASRADAAGVIDAIGALAGDRREPPAVSIAPADPALIIYTSGTTGFPKGVVHSHRNYVWSAEGFVERMRLQPSDRMLNILPLFHINGLIYSTGGALASGGTLINIARFSASQFWDVATACGATQFTVLAVVGNILAKRPRSEFNPNHKITKISGGPLDAEMYRVLQEEFNIPNVVEGYGMSEIPGVCNNPFDGVRKIGSIGKPALHPHRTFASLKVIGDAGQSVPNGEVGELVVKTPNATLGYFNDPEQTRAAFVDGWFHTGDLVRQDDDGYFYFVARKKDIIRRRGENIAGAELDRVLASHPDILEAATIGVPAELGDEEIMAVLVARTGQRPSEAAIVEWCAQHVAAMKVPRYIVFVDELPHTATHRIAKFRIKEDKTLLGRAFDRERPPGMASNEQPRQVSSQRLASPSTY